MSRDVDDVPELPAWFDDAACADMPTVWWFPEHGFRPDQALSVCAGCDIRSRCLDYALEERLVYGVWGGATEDDRRELRRQRRAA